MKKKIVSISLTMIIGLIGMLLIINFNRYIPTKQNEVPNTSEIVVSSTITLKTTKVSKKVSKTSKIKTTKKVVSRYSKSECMSYAHKQVIKMGWLESDYNNLVNLWNRESGWNYNSTNKSCYGIPQSCPGKKMASEGTDWKTNCKTQINWGLKYIKYRYGTPSKAWDHFQNKHWY